MSKTTSQTAGLAAIAGGMMIVVGALGLLLALLHQAFREPAIPAVIVYANLSACVLDIGLGVGILQRRRAAWAFAVSLACVFLVVNLLALPGMLRAGFPVGTLSALICGARVAWGVLLILDRKAF
jgi:hypothetical protein